MNLYSKFGKSFSERRQNPWKGWESVMLYLKEKQPLSLLDLGCGNGRLFKEVKNHKLEVASYAGIDSSLILLNIARDEFVNDQSEVNHLKFIDADLESDNWELKLQKKFNVICSFGLMHHIKTLELRYQVLEKSVKLLEEGGYLIFSFWQFKQFEKFLEKHLIRELGNDDYILSFGGKESGAERFCHSFSDEELSEIDKNLTNIKRVDEFNADGIENKMNKYIIWKKVK